MPDSSTSNLVASGMTPVGGLPNDNSARRRRSQSKTCSDLRAASPTKIRPRAESVSSSVMIPLLSILGRNGSVLKNGGSSRYVLPPILEGGARI